MISFLGNSSECKIVFFDENKVRKMTLPDLGFVVVEVEALVLEFVIRLGKLELELGYAADLFRISHWRNKSFGNL